MNVTNDAWFGTGAASELHGMLVASRSVELGLPVVRSAYSGVSFVAEPHGRIHSQTELFTRENRTVRVRLAQVPTLFAAWGAWFPWVCGLLLAGLWVIVPRRRVEV